MDLHLSGKVFVITGASAGIGAATCAFLAEEGAIAIGVSRKPGAAQRDGIVHLAADVTDPATGSTVVEEVIRRYGRLDGLANNVGGLRSHTRIPRRDRRGLDSRVRPELPRRRTDDQGGHSGND